MRLGLRAADRIEKSQVLTDGQTHLVLVLAMGFVDNKKHRISPALSL